MNSKTSEAASLVLAQLRFRPRLLMLALIAAACFLAYAPTHVNAAETGSISGTIEGGLEVPGTCALAVTAYDANGIQAGHFGNFHDQIIEFYGGPTEYTINDLKSGDYRLRFDQGCVGPVPNGSPISNISEYFNDKQDFFGSTTVAVAAGSATTGINVLLGIDGAISGTVTDTVGTPLDGVCVEAFDSDGDPAGVVAHTTAGHYVVNALNTGSYRLKFSDCLDPEDPSVTPEFYSDKPTLREAVPVFVSRGNNRSGVNAQLVSKPKSPGPAVNKAVIRKVKVRGPGRVRKGRKAVFRVKITNSGNVEATGVKLRVRGRGVRLNTPVGKIPAGSSRTSKVKLEPTKSGKTKITFRVSSSNAGVKRATLWRVIRPVF
ncbi:MAG: carboxypeptidase-like regulatory domain-containing protein [Solirubrobacterales bacterium]